MVLLYKKDRLTYYKGTLLDQLTKFRDCKLKTCWINVKFSQIENYTVGM